VNCYPNQNNQILRDYRCIDSGNETASLAILLITNFNHGDWIRKEKKRKTHPDRSRRTQWVAMLHHPVTLQVQGIAVNKQI
jgi:hypothetical protein